MVLNVVPVMKPPAAHSASSFPPVKPVDTFFTEPKAGEVEKENIAPPNHWDDLTEEDYIEVAKELGVEVAAIKAVVEIEAGKSHQGFVREGVPIVNFDLTMFRRFASKRGINLAKYGKSHSAVFTRNRSQGVAGAWNRFKTARSINPHAAIEGTFWGMFQIGGFNYKLCGTESLEEFERLMSRSERDQLELFAKFLINSGLDKPLKAKDWTTFARRYNGPGYAKKGYHTKLAQAYRKYSGK